VILGGGIHGCGVAHDLASRGWKDVVVIEKSEVGAGTSSKSTKLIHGGLRYLQHPRDFPLVMEGLEERALLNKIVPEIVKPLGFIFPVMKSGGMPRFMIKIGLWLYDALSFGRSLGRHHWMNVDEAVKEAPILERSMFKGFYRFFDGQTDDLALTRRVAASAVMLGAEIRERTEAIRLQTDHSGIRVVLKTETGEETISARYVVNAMGPWAHNIFSNSDINPKVTGINNQGSHLIVRDLGLKSGLFLQSPEDGRIFFVLPWEGYTLIGTTEDFYSGNPDECKAEDQHMSYLLERCNRFLSIKLTESDIISKFSGLRWLAADDKSGISAMSRSHLITEHRFGQNLILTLYGGKLTAYRALSEEIGERIVSDFGDASPSKTRDPASWSKDDRLPSKLSVPSRFSVL
jgi:glycerol-3-phosphate dehydrogenase